MLYDKFNINVQISAVTSKYKCNFVASRSLTQPCMTAYCAIISP